ncbi:MAG TPA: ABC transporter permease [Candidatus Saccharimonadales bacterium]|nr:ABC transporter permease [Candidatus Saccharimonadales bacterium]
MKVPHSKLHNPNVVPLSVIVYMAWRNLVHKKLRAFLTIFGVVIGIGAIFFLLSFGIGLQRLVTNEVIGNQSLKSIDVSTANSKILKLDEDTRQKIRKLPHVVRVGTTYSYAASLKLQGSEVDSIIYGVDENYQILANLNAVQGRLLKNNDNKSIVINRAAMESMGIKDQQSAIGKQIAVRIPLSNAGTDKKELADTFTIIGVIASGSGSEVFVPMHVFQLAKLKVYSQLKLEADESVNVNGLRRQIESMGFVTTSPIDTVDQINQIFKFFNIVLAGFGGIGMIVAILGMFNTLTISLLERTKEIGLMVALGGRSRDMRKLFIFEALLLSFIGAVLGIISAVIGGQIVNLLLNVWAQQRGVENSFNLFATPPLLVLGTIVFMLCVGVAVVYFPARRAERINPIEALRRE